MTKSVVVSKFWTSYADNTPSLLKILDIYMAYVMFSGIAQFAYMLIVGTFPYNAFLSGFIASVGSFILAGKFYVAVCYSFNWFNSESSDPNQSGQFRL